MSGINNSNNSWTIVSPEETATETLMSGAGETKQHEEESRPTAEPCCEGDLQPTKKISAEGLHTDKELVQEKPAEQCGDSPAVIQLPLPTDASEILDLHMSDLSPPEDHPEDQGLLSLSTDSSSVSLSLTPTTLSLDEPPVPLPPAETLGSAECTQAEDEGAPVEKSPAQDQQTVQEQVESEERSKVEVSEEQPASPVGPDVIEEQTEEEISGGPMKRSLLSVIEQIKSKDEEVEDEEEFQMPQRENASIFSLNKLILAAVILLGIGTILLSGVFMDLDAESDHVGDELRVLDPQGKQDWLKSEDHLPGTDTDHSQLLRKLEEGDQHIQMLQAQLQAQAEELKVARGQAAEGAKERGRWEEVERENARLNSESASLPVLRKENERMKKELESLPVLQREVETLRSVVAELKLSSAQTNLKDSAALSAGQKEERTHARKSLDDQKKKESKSAKHETYEKFQQGEKERAAPKEEKKRERDVSDRKSDKEGKRERQSHDTQLMKGKDLKKEKKKASRGDDGEAWKEKAGQREQSQKREKEWKKEKHEKVKEERETEGKKERKDHKERMTEGEGRKEKEGLKQGKEKRERGWKESGDVKEKRETGRREESEQRKDEKDKRKWKDGKVEKEQTRTNERKPWKQDERKNQDRGAGKEWKRKDEQESQRGKEKTGEEELKKKKKTDSPKSKERREPDHQGHKEQHLYGEQQQHTHKQHKPLLGQPGYWQWQRERLLHDPRAPQPCAPVQACASSQQLRPVPLQEFQELLQQYLLKAAEAGAAEAQREELTRLTAEFFRDGLFTHDKMSFHSFVEDVGEILEDFVEGEDQEEGDSDAEEEMEGFRREAMKRFSVAGAGGAESGVVGG